MGRVDFFLNSLSMSCRMAGFLSLSSSKEARRSLTTLRSVAWWWMRYPSAPTLRMKNPDGSV